MSNWLYGQQVPTEKWRSAMTIPRELSIEKIDEKHLIVSKPVNELNNLTKQTTKLKNINAANFNLTSQTGKLSGPFQLKIGFDKAEDFSITLSNSSGQKLIIGFDRGKNEYFMDRTTSGKVDFKKDFASKHTAPRFINAPGIDLTLVVDNASIELFADSGLTVMTEIFFLDKICSDIKIETKNNTGITTLELAKMKSIYNQSGKLKQKQ